MINFVRPDFLGAKSKFNNMFRRPIENGQCVDSNPTDVKLMRDRVHVLRTLLKGLVQRRSHAVLRDTLPHKEEHVLFLRMTPLQKDLYRQQMSQFLENKSISDPINAFAVGIKIWNHPDIFYNSFKNGRDGLDLELDEETSEETEIVKKKKDASANVPEGPQLPNEDEGGDDGCESALQACSIAGQGHKEKKGKSTSLEWADELLKGTLVLQPKCLSHFIAGIWFYRIHPRQY